MALTLEKMLSDRPPLVTARASESAGSALERMLEHDYSQLPVVIDHTDGGLRSIGMVTMRSIARATLHLGVAPSFLRVQHAVEAHPTIVPWSEDLWRTLDRVQDGHAILVVDEESRLKGILTGFDFTVFLRSLSEDSVALSDVESTIKQLIRRHYDADGEGLQASAVDQVRSLRRSSMRDMKKVVQACLTKVSNGAAFPNEVFNSAFEEHVLGTITATFEDLTFTQYVSIFLGADCWPTYEPKVGIAVATLRGLLETVRDLRNRLAHHRGTLSPVERDRLVYCRDLLNVLADAESEEATAPEELPNSSVNGKTPNISSDLTEIPPDGLESSVWAGLVNYLDRCEPEEGRTILRIPFIATLVQDNLPSLARRSRSWWDNDPETQQGAAWLGAGWRVASVNLAHATVTFARATEIEQAYIRAFLALFKVVPKSDGPKGSRSPKGASWQTIGYFPSDRASLSRFILWFTGDGRFGLALYVDTKDALRNKEVFDLLIRERTEIEHEIGLSLEWSRLDDRRASRIAAYFPEPFRIRTGHEDLEALCAWTKVIAPKFMKALNSRYESALGKRSADVPHEGISREDGNP